MTQQTLPFIEGKYGWALGESNWNLGMDENLVKFSFLFDRNIDSIVSALPPAVSGQAHYLTTDNRLYFAVGATYYSSPAPKWFSIIDRNTGDIWQFNGTSLVQIDSPQQLDSRINSTASTATSYTDTLRSDLANAANPVKGAGQVGFLPVGASAVGRTILSKLRDTVSVRDFGAVGDGITDDTAAIQAALDAANKVTFGSSSDSYKVSATLTLRSGHKLELCGATITQATDQTPMFTASGTTDVTITGGKFVGKSEATFNNTPSSLAICITAPNATNLVVTGNRFSNFWYSPLLVGVGGVGVEFSHNTVKGPGSAVLAADVNFRNCIGVVIAGAHTRIVGNDISATATGVIVAQGSSDVLVSSNVLHDFINEHGLYADTGIKGITISGNTIKNTGVAGVGLKVQHYDSFGITPESIVVSGNSISNTGSDGILILNTAGTTIFAEGVSIVGNTVYKAGQHGIDVRYTKGCTVSGNTVDQSTQSGIYISKSESINVSGNSVRITGSHGIFDDGTSNSVTYSNNLINTPGTNPANDCGLFIQDVNNHCIVSNIVLGLSTKTLYGLFISSATLGLETTEVRGNSMTGSNGVAMRFPATSGQLRYFGENLLQSAAGNNIGQSVPETLQRGTEEHTYFGTAAPTTGTWPQGAKVYNRYPLAGGFLGFVCVVAGTPGTWKTFGPVTA